MLSMKCHLLVATKYKNIANYMHLLGWFCVSGILKLISLGPSYLFCCSCAIQIGFIACAPPTRANELRKSVQMGSVAPSLLRAVIAGDK